MELFEHIIEEIKKIDNGKPIIIGINGIDGSGKTTLSFKIAEKIKEIHKNPIVVSVDDFANTREIRYKLGENSGMNFSI